LPDGRTVTIGRAEFDALLGERRKRAWVIVRRQAPIGAAMRERARAHEAVRYFVSLSSGAVVSIWRGPQ
jgi:hypothetical protein